MLTTDLDDDTLYRGEWLTIRAIREPDGGMPARQWAAALDKPATGRLLAAATIVENSLRSGRPPAGRAGQVAGSREGLWELRVTPAGGTPPHLRLLYVRAGQTLWAAHGFTKQSNKLDRRDIAAADRIVATWRKEART